MKKVAFTALLSSFVLGAVAQDPAPPSRQAQERQVPTSNLPALTEEQKNKLQEASSRMQREQSERYMALSKIRRELEELGKREPIDEKALREKAMEIGKLEGDLAVIRARNYHEMKSILPKEHFERLHSGQTLRPAVQQRLNRIVERAPSNAPAARPVTPPRPAPEKQPL